jgi:two-component system, OmpR family, response regulator
MYIVSKAGREAWTSADAAIPEQYRKFLWMIEVQGHERAVEALGQGHPAFLVRDWLREMQELGLIEQRSAEELRAGSRLNENEPSLIDGSDEGEVLEPGRVYFSAKRRTLPAPKNAADTVILIVEDDPDQLALADLRLSMAGYSVRVASSVAQLLTSLLNDGAPDLLLLDVMLPDGNGLDVLSKIRAHPDFAALPVILLTSQGRPAQIATGLNLGADAYLTKPYSKRVVSQAIERVLLGK